MYGLGEQGLRTRSEPGGGGPRRGASECAEEAGPQDWGKGACVCSPERLVGQRHV